MRTPSTLIRMALLVLVVTSATAHAQQWEILGTLNTSRRLPQAVPISEAEVLVAGGTSTNGPTAACEIVNVGTRRIRGTTSMAVPRANFAMLKTPDGSILAIAGWRGGSYDLEQSVERFNPVTQQWSKIGNVVKPRFQHSATMIDDHRVLIVGGRDEAAQGIRHCEIFDIRTGNSVPVRDFPFATSQHRALRLGNGTVVILGGRSGGPNSYRSDTVYSYDVASDTWNAHAVMSEPIFYPAATTDRDSLILIAGGSVREFPDGTFNATSDVSVLTKRQPATLAGQMTLAKVPQAVVQLPDGRKLIVGGWLGTARATTSCEWINASNTAITAAPVMNVARGESECLVVGGGTTSGFAAVLSIAGVDSSRAISNIVEILTVGCDASGQSMLPQSRHEAVDQAAVSSSGILLTPAEQFSRGAVWAKEKVNLTQPFTMLVGFRMTNGNDNGDVEELPSDPGADGIALVMQQQGSNAVGQYGRGIGYDGIKRSVAVEFDTYHNAPVNDPNGNHVGVQSMGRAANVSKHAPPANLAFSSNVLPMKADGTTFYAYLEYVNKQLKVYLNDRPSFRSPIIVRDIDIDSLIGLDSNGRAWVGITSATGRSMEQHEIVRWEINACPEDSPVGVAHGRTEPRIPLAPFVIVEDRVLRDDADQCVVDVVDVRGRVVWTTSTTAREIDLPVVAVSSGQYIVSVRSITGTSTQRWVVMH